MPLPSILEDHANKQLQQLIEQQSVIAQWEDRHREQLVQVLGLSHFVYETLVRDEVLCHELPDMLDTSCRSQHYRERLNQLLSGCIDETTGLRVLRQFRNRELVYIAWRDFLNNWTLNESLDHLSELAEALIFETYQWQYQICCQEWGTPCNAEGEAQPMLIIGMGKLGGGELNFSSDIDLIFTYPENGETQGQRRSIANAQFFTRLGQRII